MAPYRVVLPLPLSRARAALPSGWTDYAAVYVGFLGMQLVDLLSTAAVLWLGGQEGNPRAADVVEARGLGGLVTMKVILILATALVWIPAVDWLARQEHSVQRWAFPAVNGLILAAVVYYAVVVAWNMSNLAILVRAGR